MQIQAILSEQDLNKAILKYVVEKGYPVEGMDMSINLTKGRGTNGTYATVDFTSPGSSISVDMEDVGHVSTDQGDEASTPKLDIVGTDLPSVEETISPGEEEEVTSKTKLFG